MTKSFAPGNISCIFKIYNHKNPRWMGSYGLGFTVNEGVIVTAEFSDKNIIYFNNKKINFPAVQYVVNEMCKKLRFERNFLIKCNIKIDIKSNLPLGCGFGLSGASALATAYALNSLLKLKKSNKKLAIIAHIAEVKNKTGLGDVVNQYYGGFCMKLKPSSHFIIKKLPINNADIYCKYFSGLNTKSVITNSKLKKTINKSATNALNKIKQLIKNNKIINFEDIIKISKEFAVGSGLLQDKKTMLEIEKIEKSNGNASMIMLGNAVFSDKAFKGAIKLKITNKGAHLI